MVSDPRIGTELAGYRVEARIGRGGMATVYMAEQVRLRRKVALKILSPELSHDADFRTRFARESQLAASLEHPNVVPVYDAGEVDGLAYIAMRYVEGPDLGSVLEEEGWLEPVRTASIVGQIADALDAAHARGLIHRDVKPGNVLLDGESAYLTDFGLTKRLDASTVHTETGRFMGTLDYAAPEQFEGRPLDARTDQYSLACLAYHCLTGAPPFSGEREAAVMYAHLQEVPPSVRDRVPKLPMAVEVPLARGLSKANRDRYPSCGDFSEALESALTRGEPIPPSPKVHRRSRLLVAIASVLVLGALALGISKTVNGSDDRDVPSVSPSTAESPSIVPPVIGSAVMSLDPTTFEAVHVIPLPLAGGVAIGGGAVWVRVGSDQLRKVNPDLGVVQGTVEEVGSCAVLVGVYRDCVAAGAAAVWSLGTESTGPQSGRTFLNKIDPLANRVADRLKLAGAGIPFDITVGGGAVWVAAGSGVYQVHPKTREFEFIETGSSAGSIAWGEGALYVVLPLEGKLLRLDPSRGRVVDSILLPGNPDDVVVGNGYVWVTNYADDEVVRVDASLSSSLQSFPVGHDPRAIAFGADAVWVANRGDTTISRIALFTGDVTPIDVGGLPGDIAVGEGRVWLTVLVGGAGNQI